MVVGFATRMFGPIVDKSIQNFYFLKDVLLKSGLSISLRSYISLVLFFTFLIFVISAIATFLVLQILKMNLFLQIVYTIFIPFLISTISFVLFLFYPFQRMLERRKNIEVNLPFVLTHMGSVAQSGIPPYVIFKLISQFEEYGEAAKEFGKIVRNIDFFGMDPITAVKEVARRTPSESLKQVLLGFSSTTEAGGDVRLFLRNAGQQALFEWRIKREKFMQQLSAYAEFYTGILIAAPLFMIALFGVMNIVQPKIGGYDILFLSRLLYIIIPAINIGFLMFIKGTEVEM